MAGVSDNDRLQTTNELHKVGRVADLVEVVLEHGVEHIGEHTHVLLGQHDVVSEESLLCDCSSICHKVTARSLRRGDVLGSVSETRTADDTKHNTSQTRLVASVILVIVRVGECHRGVEPVPRPDPQSRSFDAVVLAPGREALIVNTLPLRLDSGLTAFIPYMLALPRGCPSRNCCQLLSSKSPQMSSTSRSSSMTNVRSCIHPRNSLPCWKMSWRCSTAAVS